MTGNILIVEDEPSIANTIIYALATEGYEQEWCGTGCEASLNPHFSPVFHRGTAMPRIDSVAFDLGAQRTDSTLARLVTTHPCVSSLRNPIRNAGYNEEYSPWHYAPRAIIKA